MIRRFRFPALALGLCLAPLPASAQKALTVADLPQAKPDVAAYKRAATMERAALLEHVLRSASAKTLRAQALGMLAREMVGPNTIEKLKAELEAADREAVEFFLKATRARGPVVGTLGPRLRIPLLASARFASLTDLPWEPFGNTADNSFTVIHEYELYLDGTTANVRKEMTMIADGRRVGIRIMEREIVEKNNDPKALGRAIIEQGTRVAATGETKLERPARPRKLQDASTHRMTTLQIREVKVDRCPDAQGLVRGEGMASLSIRGTAAATGGRAPVNVQLQAKGPVTGRVDDAAKLSGHTVDVTVENTTQKLGDGIDFRAGEKVTIQATTGTDPRVAIGNVSVTGTGTSEDAESAVKLMTAAGAEPYGMALQALDMAQQWWRGKNCIELAVVAGAEPKQLGKGASRNLVIDARALDEAAPAAVPVEGASGRGTLAPSAPVKTPRATFKLTAPSDDGGVAATFSSVSRRGIAKDASVLFEDVAEDVVRIQYTFSGYHNTIDADAVDACPKARRNGSETMTAELRYQGQDRITKKHVYVGNGRYSANVDFCGALRDDWCVVPGTANHDVRVVLKIDPAEAEDRTIDLDWGRNAAVALSKGDNDCGVGGALRGGSLQIAESELIEQVAPAGRPSSGSRTIRQPDAPKDGYWTLTLDNRQRQ